MKTDFNPTISNRPITFKAKIKGFLEKHKIRLKTLTKDVFEKKDTSKKIIARKEPNWCQTNEDIPNKAIIKLPVSFEEANAPLKEIGLDLSDFIETSKNNESRF